MNINDYRFGNINIEGISYTSDVIITQDEVKDSWWRKQGHNLAPEDLEEVVVNAPKIVVIGTGYYGRMQVPEETISWLKSKGIEVHCAPTGDAVKAFNDLQKHCAAIVAALHLTC